MISGCAFFRAGRAYLIYLAVVLSLGVTYAAGVGTGMAVGGGYVIARVAARLNHRG